MPARPSSAETSPSCITPAPESDGSSSCSASTRPARRWYCSAWRITPAERTGRPSSVKAAAPTSDSSAISVSCSPSMPRVMVAVKPVGTRACARARSRRERRIGAESTTGSVFGIARIAQKPPAAAARVPVSMSSSSSRPGVRRCTCGSTKAGTAVKPAAATISAPSGATSSGPTSAMRPSRISRSAVWSRPARGSSRRAPRISTVACGTGARSSSIAFMRAAAPSRRRRAGRPALLRLRRAARRAPPSAPPRRTRPAGRSAPAASRSPRRRARRRG